MKTLIFAGIANSLGIFTLATSIAGAIYKNLGLALACSVVSGVMLTGGIFLIASAIKEN